MSKPCGRTAVVLFNPWLVGDKGFHSFPKDISSKMNVIERLEFELTYDDVIVQQVSHDGTLHLL